MKESGSMDILIFGGQSNMQGQTERLSECEPVEGAWEYRFLVDRLIPLKNPVGENIRYDMTEGYPPGVDGVPLGTWLADHGVGSACYGNTNLVPEFCRAYVEESGNPVTAVSVAKGSTCITQWLPGTPEYQILKSKVQAAVRKVEKETQVGHIYLAWLQGESDAIAGTSKKDYKERLTVLKDALKADVGLECFGVIRVGRFTGDQRDLEIMDAQEEVCREDGDFLMLTQIASELNELPEYMNPHVGGHYSAKGLEVLGRCAGKALGELKNHIAG